MKNKYIKLIVMFSLIFAVTGCATRLQGKDGKIVKSEETGQALVSNIICQPENEETIKLYKENDVDISALPKCSKYNIADSNYEGLWVTIFIKPLSIFLIQLGLLFNNFGFSIIVVTLVLRLIAFPLTKKTAEQSENMKKAQPELKALEKKYANKNDRDSITAKGQEMLMIHRKYNINPAASIGFALLQAFLFFAFYESISRIPVLFEESFLGIFQLGTTPLKALNMNHFAYLIFPILIIATTYFSFKLNKTASMSESQEKQMNIMSKFMIAMIAFVSFSMPVGIAIYWVSNSVFTIIQNLMVKRSK